MIELLSVFGNPNVGVYIYANNKLALVPPGLTSKDRRRIADALDVEVIETKVADMIINGVLVAGNDKGLLLPRIARHHEVEQLREVVGRSLRIEVLNVKPTALGNLIVANNRAALVSPLLESSVVETVRRVLEVDMVSQRSLAQIPTVGSMMVITDRGGLVHPGVGEEEVKFLSNLFDVQVLPGTVNFGVYFVKAGLVANNKGALVGDETTGPELMRIQQALRLE